MKRIEYNAVLDGAETVFGMEPERDGASFGPVSRLPFNVGEIALRVGRRERLIHRDGSCSSVAVVKLKQLKRLFPEKMEPVPTSLRMAIRQGLRRNESATHLALRKNRQKVEKYLRSALTGIRVASGEQ